MNLVELCRELDDGLVWTERPMPEALALHKVVLALAIGSGSWLIHRLQEEAPDISTSGQTLETLRASLGLLQVLQRSRHSDYTPEEVELARQRIFHAAA